MRMKKILAILMAMCLAAGIAGAQADSFAAFLKSYENTPGCTYIRMSGESLKTVANQFGNPAFAFVAGYPGTTLHILSLNWTQFTQEKWEELRTGTIQWLVDDTYLELGANSGMEYFIQRDAETIYAIFAISTTRLALVETKAPIADYLAYALALEKQNTDVIEIADDVVEEAEPGAQSVPEDEPIPYQLVEVRPTFNGGGENRFYEWIANNLAYPESAKANGITGDVIVGMIINKDGSVSDIKVMRGADPLLDKEALRVIQSCPKWTPGKQDGRPVKVNFVAKISFSLRHR